MAVRAQYYLNFSKCGIQPVDEDGESIGEAEGEIRDLAIEKGWICCQDMSGDYDYFRDCNAHHPKHT